MPCMVKTARIVPRTRSPWRVQRTENLFSTSPPLFGEIESTTRSAPWLTTVETAPGPTAPVVVAGAPTTRKTSASKTREAATGLHDRRKRFSSSTMDAELGSGGRYTLSRLVATRGAVCEGLVIGVSGRHGAICHVAARWPEAPLLAAHPSVDTRRDVAFLGEPARVRR